MYVQMNTIPNENDNIEPILCESRSIRYHSISIFISVHLIYFHIEVDDETNRTKNHFKTDEPDQIIIEVSKCIVGGKFKFRERFRSGAKQFKCPSP